MDILAGCRFTELQMIIKFLYTGETEVAEDKLNSLLDTAQYLEIKGLIEYLPKCGPGQELMGLPATSEDPNSEKEFMYEVEVFDDFLNEEKSTVLDDAQAQEINENINEKEIIQKLSDKVQNFPCDKCDYRGTCRKVLKEHIKTKHEGVTFPCSECPFVSASTTTRNMHTRTKHRGLKFECSVCDKEFANPGSLRKHKLYTHEGIRYNCNTCEYSGSTLQMLKFHRNKAHQNK